MKITDSQLFDNSRPYYHGTDATFDKFDATFKGSNTGWDNTKHGFFFADKKENALLFGDILITAYLDIKNPIDLRLHSIFSLENQASLIWEILTGDQLEAKKALRKINREISLGEIGDLYDSLNSEDSHLMFEKAGYDGIISSLGDDHPEFVVFHTSQIEIISIERQNFIGRSR
ncbi:MULTISPECIES: hypothetical protein [Sphingobacterium]|uniref:ADP-ribosyltransferase-containing protein n=1 Tax=Sphingobacterium TaxID=28453 RepID=UPI00257E9A4E|nr:MULTISPECIES: hypothetical protein [Sphingobacterium]